MSANDCAAHHRLTDCAFVQTNKMTETTSSSSASVANVSNTTQAAAASIPKAVIKNADMSEEMQQQAVDIASEAMTKHTVEKDIAAFVKKTMDAKFGPTWHAVVGKNYGSYVTHGGCLIDLAR